MQLTIPSCIDPKWLTMPGLLDNQIRSHLIKKPHACIWSHILHMGTVLKPHVSHVQSIWSQYEEKNGKFMWCFFFCLFWGWQNKQTCDIVKSRRKHFPYLQLLMSKAECPSKLNSSVLRRMPTWAGCVRYSKPSTNYNTTLNKFRFFYPKRTKSNSSKSQQFS